MEKEIPFSQEKRSKADRLRQAARNLQEFPLESPLSESQWNQATEELTKDDLDHLRKLAGGHRDRAEEALKEGDAGEAAEEATAAVLLWPQDLSWARETGELFRTSPKNPETDDFLRQLNRRVGKRPAFKLPRWSWAALFAVSLALGVAAVLTFWHPTSFRLGDNLNHGPRTLEVTVDTQGFKTNTQVVQARLLIFPEATVAELSAWITFPEHSLELWEGRVSVLDSKGQVLAQRDVTFRPSSQGPLEAGQGLEIFQQFDAWPWFDQAASFQISTSRILAKEAHPADRKEWPLIGAETLTTGYNLKVWLQSSQWSDRFASKVDTLTFELENTGLKPFSELQFALVWHNEKGQVLKTIRFRPVSAFRTALPPGARLGWQQEAVFDTEVFSWAPGSEPYPVLELLKWH